MDINVKSLILDVSETDTTETKTGHKTAIKPEVSYETVLEDGCDLAVMRKTSKTEKMMVLLVSQGQYYIKDIKNGEIERLTLDKYVKFMSDLSCELTLTDVSWTDRLEKGKVYGEALMSLLNNKNFRMLRNPDMPIGAVKIYQMPGMVLC